MYMTKQTPVILTIDDESLIRHSYRLYLEDCGYEVQEAENGRIGLEMIHANLPDRSSSISSRKSISSLIKSSL